MSMTPQSSTPQMPSEFGVSIDPNYRKTLQSRIRALLQSKLEGFPGSYPVHFEPSHLQLLADEEYFVTEKVAGVRYMLLSTHTPKGPACFLIDRHYEISFVPNLLLPLRDNPTKFQNETLLDGEMVVENDGNKKSLRFLVFDLIALNGSVITQRSYSTRLGMMDQDILAVQASKTSEVKSKEPFTIERKPMQRSYGLNVILSASKKHKHGGEGLIFVPVKQPYVPGTSPKLLKWKSLTTAQFQIKVTYSRERKPLYCIHVKHGSGSKFYDYVTPDHNLAAEWHSSSPDGKIAEFWWDPQWPTQMFEKGYGLETRPGGWRFYRIREDKKDIDEEAAVLAVVKKLDTLVTRQQLESQIDHIRTQWKAREAGTPSNGNTAQPSQSHRPLVRQLSINSSLSDSQPPPMTPSLSSPFLQSPSSASHLGSHGYFSKKDRERKSSVDEYGSSGSLPAMTSGSFSHPLPPKPPPFQPRQTLIDQPQSTGTSSNSVKTEQEPNSGSNSAVSPASSANQTSDRKSTPPPSTTPTSASPVSGTVVKNPLKLSQVPAHLQPIKSWMTVSPVPRAQPSDKSNKLARSERRDSRDSAASGGDNSPRSNTSATSISRKSSLSITDITKEVTTTTLNTATRTGDSTNSRESSSNSATNPTSAPQDNQPQTPTPAHTPTPAGIPRSSITPALPPTFSLPPTSIALPNLVARNAEKNLSDGLRNTEPTPSNDSSETFSQEAATTSPTSAESLSENMNTPNTPVIVLGKRTFGPSSSMEDQSEDSLAQRRKLSDGAQSSPRTEAVMTGIGTLNLIATQSPKPSYSSPLAVQDNKKLSPLLSPLSSPGVVTTNSDDKQSSPHPSYPSGSKFVAASKLPHEKSAYPDLTPNGNNTSELKEEEQEVNVLPTLTQTLGKVAKHEPSATATEDVEMKEFGTVPSVISSPLPTPALTVAEKLAYEPPSDLEKKKAIEKAKAEATYRIERQGEFQAAKENKAREDVERFKERSRIRKEKAQKRKLQEVNEAPIQDRRAQPVRQINQQQGRQSSSDTTLLRGQSQSSQRQVSSPQDSQRLVYLTRQSKAQQQSTQNSPKVQPHTTQYPSNVKDQGQSPGELLSQPSLQRDQQSVTSDLDALSPQEHASGSSSQKMLEIEDASRHHRRINLMDHQIHMSQPHEPSTSEQRGITEQYGQTYIKRLDVGQHGESNHRRSHSDIGVMYNPVVTAIAQPHSVAPGPPSGSAGPHTPTVQQNSPHIRPELEHRQDNHPSLMPGILAPHRSDVDSPRMRNNNAFQPAMKETAPIKLESKAKLQFILNDDDSVPGSTSEDDSRERRPSPERATWGQHSADQEPMQRAQTQTEYGARSPYPHEYGLQEHQVHYAHPNIPTSTMESTLTRRQPSKKQKLSQDITGMDQHFSSRAEEHEYHLRQSQMQSMPPRTTAQQVRPIPPADQWPQQTHPQHLHPSQPISSQPHGSSNHGQANALARRIPVEAQTPPSQQPIECFA
ncbi:Dcp1p-Dcp2p decapping enzyme complex alpha subunit [Mortierella sp. AM989]|nr:Dcp1p-Dcp2p decapping enzyme complex alpha subunit [Mortierella sp. AM989]